MWSLFHLRVETDSDRLRPGSLLTGPSHTPRLGVSSPGQTQHEVIEESVGEEQPQTVAGKIVARKSP